MGRPFPGFRVGILDEEGEELPPGRPGEAAIALPHPGAFLEYWGDPDKTREKMHDGWVYTGDTVLRDEGGSLWFVGRADDIISSGGYRIGPAEIEECLLSHPEVLMAAVIGVPDELRGEAVAAFVVVTESSRIDGLREALQEHVKRRLAFYEYPRTIRFVDDLPMTTTGKIRRAELRRRAAEETS